MSCPDCFTGTLHCGTPTGNIQTVHSVPTYVAPAPSGSPKAIVVYISDAFGWELPNARILADRYASALNVTVYLPDFMGGYALPADVLEVAGIARDPQRAWTERIPNYAYALRYYIPWKVATRPAAADATVYGFFHALRQSTKLPLGAAGFCWGGKWTIKMAAGETGQDEAGAEASIDAGFTAHPSAQMLDLPQDVSKLEKPLSIAVGTEDYLLPMEKVREMEQAMASSASSEMRVYEGAKHGFAVRGDPNDEKVLRQGKEAEEQAIQFFQRHLLGGKA